MVSSNFNTKIYFIFNSELEAALILNPSEDVEIACLHHVVGHLLTTTVESFKNGWNEHPISTAENFTSRQLFTLGLLRLKAAGKDNAELNQVMSFSGCRCS